MGYGQRFGPDSQWSKLKQKPQMILHTGSSEYLNYTTPELPVSMTHFIE